MRFRIASAIAGLVLALSMTALVFAQAEDDAPASDDTAPALSDNAPVSMDQPNVAPTLFLQVLDPAEQDLELPLDTAQLTIHALTIPGAVVSVEGDLADTDDQGNVAAITLLDEGANEVQLVASDSQGNQVSATVYVVRG